MELLGSQLAVRPDRGAPAVRACGLLARRAKVDEGDGPLDAAEHVLRLDVAVDDGRNPSPELVEDAQELLGDAADLAFDHGAAHTHDLRQRLTDDELLGDVERRPGGPLDCEMLKVAWNRGVAKVGEDARLALEELDPLPLARLGDGEPLQRDTLVGPLARRFIRRAEPPAASVAVMR